MSSMNTMTSYRRQGGPTRPGVGDFESRVGGLESSLGGLQAAQQQYRQQRLNTTGLQRQLAALDEQYANVRSARLPGGTAGGIGGVFASENIGFDVRDWQKQQALQQGTADLSGQQVRRGSGTLDQMAKNMAQRYGLPIGRGRLVDEFGNFLLTPEQIADASGGQLSMGEAASIMGLISRGIARQQNVEQQKRGIAAIQTGLGQVQQRGRGSLASMQTGLYQDLADLHANQQWEAHDFSSWIEREQQEIAMELERRAQQRMEEGARGQFLTGVGLAVAGIATGNVGLIVTGGGMAGGAAGGTGWF